MCSAKAGIRSKRKAAQGRFATVERRSLIGQELPVETMFCRLPVFIA